MEALSVPKIRDWLNKSLYILAMEYCAAIKNHVVLGQGDDAVLAATSRGLEFDSLEST